MQNIKNHQHLFEAVDEVRGIIAQELNLNEAPDDLYDIESIVEEVYENDGEVLSPLVYAKKNFWIIAESHRYWDVA